MVTRVPPLPERNSPIGELGEDGPLVNVPSNNSNARPLKMPQSIRLVLYFRGPAMAQTALKRTRPAKIVMGPEAPGCFSAVPRRWLTRSQYPLAK